MVAVQLAVGKQTLLKLIYPPDVSIRRIWCIGLLLTEHVVMNTY